MFAVNDTVFYGVHGVCTVSEISKREFCGAVSDYYTLKPVYSERSTVYVPVGKEGENEKLRKVLSEEEVYEMIRSLPTSKTMWVENDSLRKSTYAGVLKSGSPSALASLIKTLYERQTELEKQNKKMHASDKRALSEAEKMLHEEIAFVLHLERDRVVSFISECLADEKSAE